MGNKLEYHLGDKDGIKLDEYFKANTREELLALRIIKAKEFLTYHRKHGAYTEWNEVFDQVYRILEPEEIEVPGGD